MNKKNNSFFVWSSIIYGLLCLLLIDIIAFTLFAIYSTDEDTVLYIPLTIMFLVLPLSLIVWDIIYMMPRLEITEEGITKSLFGHIVKIFKWEEIKFIYFKGNFNQWVILAKRDLSKCTLTRNRLSKYNIYFFMTEDKMQILEQYLPDNLKSQLNYKK